MRPIFALFAVLVLATACDSGPSATTSPSTDTNVANGPSEATSGTWTFDLRQGVSTLHVLFADLHGPLYRIAAPAGTDAHPVASIAGTTVGVTVSGGSTSLDVTLDRGRPWNVRLSAGASTLTVDATHGSLAGLSTLAGVSAVDVSAAAAQGLVELRDVGGSSSFDLHVPDDTGVQINAMGGAGDVSLFGTAEHGVQSGSQFQTDGFGGSGYVVNAEAGVSSIVVDATG